MSFSDALLFVALQIWKWKMVLFRCATFRLTTNTVRQRAPSIFRDGVRESEMIEHFITLFYLWCAMNILLVQSAVLYCKQTRDVLPGTGITWRSMFCKKQHSTCLSRMCVELVCWDLGDCWIGCISLNAKRLIPRLHASRFNNNNNNNNNNVYHHYHH